MTISGGFKSSTTTQYTDKAHKDLTRSMGELASGKRNPLSDPAGTAIAAKLLTEAVVSDQGARNSSDAVSYQQVAEGGLDAVQGMMGRMAELATQAANGTLSDDQRSALNTEYGQLKQEIDRIGASTTYNGQGVFGTGQVNIQTGQDTTTLTQVNVAGLTASLGDISSAANALNALASVANTSDGLSQDFARIGADTARLGVVSENLTNNSITRRAAEERITGIDVAEKVSEKTRSDILLQTGTAMQAHGNMNAQLYLKLLG